LNSFVVEVFIGAVLKKIPLTPFDVIVHRDDFPLSPWERAG